MRSAIKVEDLIDYDKGILDGLSRKRNPGDYNWRTYVDGSKAYRQRFNDADYWPTRESDE